MTVSRAFHTALDADRHNMLGLVLSATLPLAVFVIANGIGELNHYLPLFFAPFGLPGWVGGALHLGSLPLLGIARWMVVNHGAEGKRAGWWIVGLMAATIAFPFVVAPLDSLMLCIIAFAMLVVALGTMVRVAAVEPKAALVMAPGLAWMGFSAFVGLSFAAGWAPPFAVTNSHAAV
ncbi:tryptophan-rich sensory protein [Devosia sp. 2618]|uniref:tryptophan-rich sensory protein n=1 Tax=Devosia sp. 2618 TaxID=3156454 RepID=UPI00339AF06F